MNIFLDYDDTLVDLINPTISWVNELVEANRKVEISHIDSYDYLIKEYGIWVRRYWQTSGNYLGKIFPLDGSIEFVNSIKKTFGEENVFIVTRSHKDIISEKIKHIIHFYNIKSDKIFIEHHKWKVISDGVLIDDYIDNLDGHVIHNLCPGILFNYRENNPWVKSEMETNYIKYLTTYNDILTYLESINETIIRSKKRNNDLQIM